MPDDSTPRPRAQSRPDFDDIERRERAYEALVKRRAEEIETDVDDQLRRVRERALTVGERRAKQFPPGREIEDRLGTLEAIAVDQTDILLEIAPTARRAQATANRVQRELDAHRIEHERVVGGVKTALDSVNRRLGGQDDVLTEQNKVLARIDDRGAAREAREGRAHRLKVLTAVAAILVPIATVIGAYLASRAAAPSPTPAIELPHH